MRAPSEGRPGPALHPRVGVVADDRSPEHVEDREEVRRTIPRGVDRTDPDPCPGVDPDVWLLHVRYARTRSRAELATLLHHYDRYALSLARRMHRRHEPLEDLQQVARTALVIALQRFDPGRGCPFPSYATPTILGALRRHYRDCGWSVRIPRRAQELLVRSRVVGDELTARTGRPPTVGELALAMRVDIDDLLQALEADHVRGTVSLDPCGDHARGREDVDLVAVENQIALDQAIGELDGRDRDIIELYYFRALSQREIARRYDVSQMQVSRWITSILERLRGQFTTA